MVAPSDDATDGLDPFKIAGAIISGWIPSIKAVRPCPFNTLNTLYEERLWLWLEYHNSATPPGLSNGSADTSNAHMDQPCRPLRQQCER